MNLEPMLAAILGSLTAGGITATVAWVKMGRESVKSVATVSAQIDRIDRERDACRKVHDKYDATVTSHHMDDDRHVTSSWKDEVRDRFDRIEQLQNTVIRTMMKAEQ